MSALVWAGLLGATATLTRIVRLDLWRRYPWFCAWTASSIVKAAAITYVTHAHGISSPVYVLTWELCHTGTALLLAFAGVEAYCHVANDYPRIGTYGRRVLIYSSAVALVLALMPVSLDSIMDRLRTGTLSVSVLVRTSAIAVCLGLAFATSHIRSVPIPERRNLIHHRWLMMTYCVGQAVGMTMLVLTSNRAWALIYMGMAAVCWCLWAVLLTRRGEWLERRMFTDGDRLAIQAAVGDLKTFASEQADRVRARR